MRRPPAGPARGSPVDEGEHPPHGGDGEAVSSQDLKLAADEHRRWLNGDRLGAQPGDDGAATDRRGCDGLGDGVGAADELRGDRGTDAAGSGENGLRGGFTARVDDDVSTVRGGARTASHGYRRR